MVVSTLLGSVRARRDKAARAGAEVFKPGDVILAINDVPTRDIAELIRVLGACKPGEPAKVSRRRDGTVENVVLVLHPRER